MVKKTCVISVDIGTSSVRACLIDALLTIHYQTQMPLSLITDIDGKAEQDPIEVLTSTYSSIRNAAVWASENGFMPEAISFSNAVSSLVQLDTNFEPLGDFLTYADLRSHNEAEELRRNLPKDILVSSACPLHASYWMPKILWLKKQKRMSEPTRYLCTIKDLLIHKMSGLFVTDYSNAVATGMCDVRNGNWNENYFNEIEIDQASVPKIRPTTEIVEIKSSIAQDLKLPEKIQIALGATDGVLSSLGAGAIKSGQVTTMIGSSGACRIASDSPLLTPGKMRTWSYPLADGIWVRGGAMNSGGLVTQWLLDNFYSDLEVNRDQRMQKALFDIRSSEPGSNGLIFLPYIFGERAPIWNERARGVFFGIHGKHRREHFARATIEGIMYSLFSIFEIINSNIDNDIEIHASGGYTQSEEFLQIQSDLFGLPVNVPRDHEGSSIGAAALAFRAIGEYSSFEKIPELIKIVKVFKPDERQFGIYQSGYQQFKNLYKYLEHAFL